MSTNVLARENSDSHKYITMKQAYRIKGELAPWSWKSGPDEVDHRLYVDCQRARAQAKFRNEEWTITEEEYIGLWRQGDQYLYKGRTPSDLCLVRVDPEGSWSLDNVQIITRLDHFKACNKMRAGRRLGRRTKNENI